MKLEREVGVEQCSSTMDEEAECGEVFVQRSGGAGVSTVGARWL